MRAAIYTVSKGGKEIARLPALIWVRLAEPGQRILHNRKSPNRINLEETWNQQY